MSTFLDFASASVSELGQVGIGQSVSPEEANQALQVCNRMTQKWSIQRLLQFWVSTNPFPLVAGQQQYGLGPTGPDFIMANRPVWVETAACVIPGTVEEKPQNMLSRTEWGAIRDKGAFTSSNGAPQDVWVEMSYPNLALHFWPIPSSAMVVKLGIWNILQQFATIFDTLALPPGYETAIQHNLAFELAPFYDVNPAQLAGVQQLAADSLIELQKLNAGTLKGSFGESETLVAPTTGNPPGAAAPTTAGQ